MKQTRPEQEKPEFSVVELVTPRNKGEKKTSFETFTLGKETFQLLRQVAEDKLNIKSSVKKETIVYLLAELLRLKGYSKQKVIEFITNASK